MNHPGAALSLCLTLLVPAICPGAETLQARREGGNWIVTLSGVLPAQLTQVSAEGSLTVRGKAAEGSRYSIRIKLAAPGEREAKAAAQAATSVGIKGSEITFTGPGDVSLELPSRLPNLALGSEEGNLDVADLAGSVYAETMAGRVNLDRIGGNVEIRSAGGAATLGRINGNTRCYSGGGGIRAIRIGGEAQLETGGGDITIGEVLGPVRAVTRAGGIRIEHAGAGVFAETSGGPVSVLRAEGGVIARSVAGPIEIASAPSAQARTGGGSIRLSNISGPMRAFTDRGEVFAHLARGTAVSDSFLATGAGDIIVLLPSDMGVEVEAEIGGTQSREAMSSDYPGLRFIARASSVFARGSLNGGGPGLRLRGAGGRIQIRRK
jgi:DUF4097 and DUF4098 domain-containing protein YvlB